MLDVPVELIRIKLMRFAARKKLIYGVRHNLSSCVAARRRLCCVFMIAAVVALSGGACFSNEKGETFYGRVEVRAKQELRWSDGGLPGVFDPARAANAPDTDAVRAIFEGLTELDSRTLTPLPAAAERWETDEENRVWTFYLRQDARWSNGDAVVAADFVRAWRRAIELGEQVPHRALLANIEGAQPLAHNLKSKLSPANANSESAERPAANQTVEEAKAPAAEKAPTAEVDNREHALRSMQPEKKPEVTRLGVEAVSPRTLRVRLVKPDANLPALVANPLFYPVHEADLRSAEKQTIPSESVSRESKLSVSTEQHVRQDTSASPGTEFIPTISNGAFVLKSRSTSEVVIERSINYREAGNVALETVRFVQTPNTETTLALYRAGEIDVVTNAAFEPLTIKLLAPHEDFRRTTYGAINYYSFNLALPPFDDVRVREAFAIAVDRTRLARDTLSGAVEPAYTFLPQPLANTRAREDATVTSALRADQLRARELLADAGFSGSRSFPIVRLLINRNDTHRMVAQAIAAMWRETLGVETEIIAKDWSDYEAALESGDYSIARRSLVSTLR